MLLNYLRLVWLACWSGIFTPNGYRPAVPPGAETLFSFFGKKLLKN